MTPLVAAAELRDLVAAQTVTVLDVRYRLGEPSGLAEFESGHVPGAAYVDLDRDLAAPPGPGGRHPLPDPGMFAEAMRRYGVRRHRPVVVYDDWAGHAAARCWWLLRHHGHDNVRVLDGAWSAWVSSGAPVEMGPAVLPSAGDFVASAGRLPVVEAGQVPGVTVLIDARAAERHRGEVETVDPVAGRIPGAVNVPTGSNLAEDGRFLSADRLRQLYAGVGAREGVDTAVYCGSGVTACHDLLALEVAGITAALYPGSWSSWIADPDRPIERG